MWKTKDIYIKEKINPPRSTNTIWFVLFLALRRKGQTSKETRRSQNTQDCLAESKKPKQTEKNTQDFRAQSKKPKHRRFFVFKQRRSKKILLLKVARSQNREDFPSQGKKTKQRRRTLKVQARKIFLLKARSQNREEHWRCFRASKKDFRAGSKKPKHRRTHKIFVLKARSQNTQSFSFSNREEARRFSHWRLQEAKTEKIFPVKARRQDREEEQHWRQARIHNREEHWIFFRASKKDFRAGSKNPKQRRTLKVFSCSEKKQEDSPVKGCKKSIQRRFSRSRKEDKIEKKQEAKPYFYDQAQRSYTFSK